MILALYNYPYDLSTIGDMEGTVNKESYQQFMKNHQKFTHYIVFIIECVSELKMSYKTPAAITWTTTR